MPAHFYSDWIDIVITSLSTDFQSDCGYVLRFRAESRGQEQGFVHDCPGSGSIYLPFNHDQFSSV